MPKGHVKKGLHLEQLFEVRGGHSLGDQPQLWWRTFERFLVEELKFDQHQMDPCVRLCFVSRGTNILDEHLPMKSLSFLQRRGTRQPFRVPLGSSCCVLRVRVNDQSGATWEDAMRRLRAGLFFRKCGTLVVASSLESVLEQRRSLHCAVPARACKIHCYRL